MNVANEAGFRDAAPHLLLFLYADQLVDSDPFVTAGTALPWRNVRVRTQPLAVMVWSAAFLDLRDQGIVALDLAGARSLTRREPAVRVGLRGDTPRFGGVRGMIVDAIQAGRYGTVEGIVFAALEPVPDACETTARAACLEAGDAGFLRVRTAGAPNAVRMTGVGGELLIEPRGGRIAAAAPAAKRTVLRMTRFTGAEPELAATIAREASAGMRARSLDPPKGSD